MKNCSYCGRDNDIDAVHCRECGTEFVKEVVEASTPPSTLSLALRKIVSFIVGTLMFLIVAPEFRYMPKVWILFWIALPIAPILCVWFSAGRNRFVEATGWVLHIVGLAMFAA